jgi:hypothetical protein
MKKNVIVSTCLLLLLASNAGAGDKFGLALKAGPNFSNMRVQEKSTLLTANTDMRVEPSYMLEMEVVITEHISYVAAFQYLVHSYSSSAVDSIYPYQYSRSATYFGFPNKLRVFIHQKKLQFFFSLGVNAESLLSARFFGQYEDPTFPSFDIDIKGLFSELIITPEIDAGLRYPLAGFFLTCEATYAHGTDDVNNADLDSFATHSRKIRDFRLMFGVSRYLF